MRHKGSFSFMGRLPFVIIPVIRKHGGRGKGEKRSSAISVDVAGIADASTRYLPRLTHSSRFLLRRMTHRGTASFVPRRAHQRGDLERGLLFLYISTLPAIFIIEASKAPDYQIRHARDIIAHNFTRFYVPKQFKNGSKTVQKLSAGKGFK